MSKSSAFPEKQTRSGGRGRLRRSPLWVYILVGGLALAVAIGLAAYFTQRGESSPAASSPSSGEPLSAAAVGQPAPGFSLPNQYKEPYTLTPGDGKNHLLVFYMGYF